MGIKSILRKIRIMFSSGEKYIKLLRKEGVTIGSGCSIDKTAIFGTEPYLITLDDNVRITKGVCFITHDGGLWTPRLLGLVPKEADKFGKIHIGANTNIGWNTLIMPGVTIGKNCVIGCGAIVTKSIPDNSVAAGIPAKVIETVEEYAQKNVDKCLMAKQMSSEIKKQYIIQHL